MTSESVAEQSKCFKADLNSTHNWKRALFIAKTS